MDQRKATVSTSRVRHMTRGLSKLKADAEAMRQKIREDPDGKPLVLFEWLRTIVRRRNLWLQRCLSLAKGQEGKLGEHLEITEPGDTAADSGDIDETVVALLSTRTPSSAGSVEPRALHQHESINTDNEQLLLNPEDVDPLLLSVSGQNDFAMMKVKAESIAGRGAMRSRCLLCCETGNKSRNSRISGVLGDSGDPEPTGRSTS